MDIEEETLRLIRLHGGVLSRMNNHQVWKFPDGRIFTMALTPSDHRAGLNSLSDLRRFLGVPREIYKNPNRKAKRGSVRSASRFAAFGLSSPTPKRADWRERLEMAFQPRQAERFVPLLECQGYELERVAATPLWVILRRLIGLGPAFEIKRELGRREGKA